MEGVTGSIPVPPTSLCSRSERKATAPKPNGEGGPADASYGSASQQISQYVARPPETSNTAPVENEQSSDASHAIIAASSSTSTKRFIGILDSM